MSPVEFEGVNGAVITVGHPLVKAALASLHQNRPRSFTLDELRILALQGLEQSGIAPGPFDRGEDHLHLLQTLFLAFRGGLVEVGARARRLVSRPSERPLASPLARLQARRNHGHTTTLLHAHPLADTRAL